MSVLDNKRYQDMELAEGVYVPDINVDYPIDDPLARLMPVKKVRDIKSDDTYPFLDDSLGFKFRRFIAYYVIIPILRVVLALKFGLRIKGRENLEPYKEQLKGTVVSVSNHCFPLDGLCVFFAMRRKVWIPMLADLFTGSNWWVLTHFGGVPLSDGSMSATKKFNAAFDEHNARKEYIHIFAEARSWPFYKPVRPFQKGAFTMAYRWGAPIVPMNISYRPRTGFYKLFGKPEIPLITVNVGTPIFPDTTAPRKTEVDRLLEQTHAAVCSLGGIIKNSWPAIWND